MKNLFLKLLIVALLTPQLHRPVLAASWVDPVAVSFSAAVPVTVQSVIQLQGSDGDGTALTFSIVGSPSHGALSQLNASTGAVVYTPTAGYTGSDSFTYKVTSGGADSNTATVSITVTAAKTRIVHTFLDPGGNPRAGKVTFILSEVAQSPSGLIAPKSSVSCTLNSSGVCDIQVYPSRSLSPVQYYQVNFEDTAKRQVQLLGIYDIPASTTTISLNGYRVTDTNLAARYTFASKAEVDALTTAVVAATTAALFPSLTTGKLIFFNGTTFVSSIVSESGGNLTVAGGLTATTLSGNGNAITNLNAANLSGTLPALNASNLTSIPAGNLAGTVADGRLSGNVTLLGNTATGSGSIVRGTSPTIAAPTLTGTATAANITASGTVTANNFVGNGSGLTGITGATGGVANTGTTTIGSDTDSSGNEVTVIQTQGTTRLQVSSTEIKATVPIIDYGGRHYGVESWASLAAAVTAMGTTNEARLLVSKPLTISSNVTITKNITVEFTNTGMLNVDNGVIVDFRRTPIADPNQRIFTLTGTGRVIFGGVDCTGGCNASAMNPAMDALRGNVFHAGWWGWRGDWNGTTGTDNSTVAAKIADVLPNGSTLHLPAGAARITAEWAINNRRQIQVIGAAPVGDVNTSADHITSLVYDGAAGGTILHLGRVRNSTFSQIFLSARGLVDKGVYFDNGSGTAGDISTSNTLYDVTIYGEGNRANFIAVDIGNAANGNNDEFHKIISCHIRGGLQFGPWEGSGNTGTGIKIRHANVKAIKIIDTVISQCAIGVDLAAGSYKVEKGHNGYNNIGHRIGVAGEPIEIEEESEGLEQVLVVTGGGQPIKFKNGRYDRDTNVTNLATLSKPLFDLGSAGQALELDNTFIGGFHHQLGAPWTTNNIYVFRSTNTGAQASLKFNHVTYYNLTTKTLYDNWATFGAVAINGQQFVANATEGAGNGIGGIINGLTVPLAVVEGGSNNAATAFVDCTPGTVCLGGGVEVTAQNPNRPNLALSGTHGGSTQHCFAIVGLDSAGNKTKATYPTCTSTANATLDSTNKIDLSWAAIPNIATYDVIAMNNGNGEQWRLVTNTASTSYSVVANPSGSFDYVRPAYNQALSLLFRGNKIFTDNVDTTKRFHFNVSGVSTGTDREIAVPNRNGTMAFTSGTLTNNNCAKFDASGNLVDAGTTCGGSSLTINSTDTAIPYRSNSTTFANSPLFRVDANTMAQRNGTTSQAFQVYKSYTDDSNYERLGITPTLIVFATAGTGSPSDFTIRNASGFSTFYDSGAHAFRSSNGSTTWWQVNTSGHLVPGADNTREMGSSSVRPSAVWTVKTCYITNVCDFYGSGSPEGAVTAAVGSTYRRTDGGASTSFYVKESGSGNTGWIAK